MLVGDLLLTHRADGGQQLCPDHRSQPSFRAVEGRDEQLSWVRSGSGCFIQSDLKASSVVFVEFIQELPGEGQQEN